MRIATPEILPKDGLVHFRTQVDSVHGSRLLWYTIPPQHAHLLSNSCDGPLVGLLIPAMAKGEDIYVEGPLSERLYHNVAGPYQVLLRKMLPSLQRINVTPSDLVRHTDRPDGVATGFSAGVDSFSVVADYFLSETPASLKLTHLLFNNVGSHGPAGERLFDRRYDRVAATADKLGLPLVKINSNLDDFYDDKLHFERTHTPRNASVALLLQGGVGRFLYASAFSYRDLRVAPMAMIAHGDAVALPMLSTDTLDMISAGSEHTRVEKTIQLANFPVTYDALDVCVREQDARNCSTCKKCMKTMLTLEIAGLLGRYEESFDLAEYRSGRDRYVESILPETNDLIREIFTYANTKGFRFSKKTYINAWMRNPRKMLRRSLWYTCKDRIT